MTMPTQSFIYELTILISPRLFFRYSDVFASEFEETKNMFSLCDMHNVAWYVLFS